MTEVKTIPVSELGESEMKAVTVGALKILLVKSNGTIHAFEDKCPHQGTQLSKGTLQQNVITCGRHYWTFDATTGKGINPKTACLKEFTVREEEGMILCGFVIAPKM
jgi:toluene monooxygenase system ferredoxin subunit